MNKFFQKKSLTQSITFMALMAAINVIFVVLETFVPFLIFLIIFLLPLTSVLVTLAVKKRYFPIYAAATCGLCFLVASFNIADTLFYILPSLISGFIFGLMVQKKMPGLWILFTSTVVQMLLTYISIPLIELIYMRNIINDVVATLKISDFPYISYIVSPTIFILSLIQESIAFLIIKEEISRFGQEIENVEIMLFANSILSILFGCASIILALTYSQLSLLFVLFGLYFAFANTAHLLTRNKISIFISCGVAFVITLITIPLFYKTINKPFLFLLCNVFVFLVSIIALVNNRLLKQNNKV